MNHLTRDCTILGHYEPSHACMHHMHAGIIIAHACMYHINLRYCSGMAMPTSLLPPLKVRCVNQRRQCSISHYSGWFGHAGWRISRHSGPAGCTITTLIATAAAGTGGEGWCCMWQHHTSGVAWEWCYMGEALNGNGVTWEWCCMGAVLHGSGLT